MKVLRAIALTVAFLVLATITGWWLGVSRHDMVPGLFFLSILLTVLLVSYLNPPMPLPDLVRKWMQENGYLPFLIERRLWRDGPFMLENGWFDAVFRIKVTAKQETRLGWLKLTRPFPVGWGRTRPGEIWNVIVIWDDDPQVRLNSSVTQPGRLQPTA